MASSATSQQPSTAILDEDGIPTGDEWVMDTDPTNGASFLAFDAVWPLYSNCWVVSTNKEPPNEVVSTRSAKSSAMSSPVAGVHVPGV